MKQLLKFLDTSLYFIKLLKTLWCVTSLCVVSHLCNPKDCRPPGFSVHGDSPSKNTGVGCHAFFFQSVQFSHSVMSDSLQPHGLQHTRPPCPGNKMLDSNNTWTKWTNVTHTKKVLDVKWQDYGWFFSQWFS